MKKKKLLVFASTFPRWKNDTNPPFVYELSKRLTTDFDVSILAPHYPGAKRFEVMDGMDVYRFKYFFEKYEKLAGSGGILPTLKKNKWFYLQVPFFLTSEFFALKRLVKKIKPDVIHSHWIIPQGFVTSLVHKLTGVPYVITSHGSDLMGVNGFSWVKRFVLRNAKKVTVVGDTLKKMVEELEPKTKVEVIPMGIDTELFYPGKEQKSLRQKYGIQGPFLLFVGRLTPEKGVDLLLESLPEIVKTYPKTKLIIIGEGPIKNSLVAKMNNFNLSDNVEFIGWVRHSSLSHYYATADLFIGPSTREGFGLTFAEAAASGCIVIGPNLGEIPKIISLTRRGFLMEDYDKNHLSNLIIKAISSLNSNYSSKIRAHKSVSTFLSWKKIAEDYRRSIYENLA